MPLPGKWTHKEILILGFYKKISFPMLRSAVENFDSLYDLTSSAIEGDLFPNLNQKELFPGKQIDLTDEIERQMEVCDKNNYKLVSYWDDEYPKLLKEITYPPLTLFVRGNLQPSNSTAISIVGTRKCTAYGRLSAERFAGSLAKRGIVIVSGLAYGIDTMAHRASISTGGITYSVIASGLDMINPDLTNKEADKIVESGGAIISEYRCGTQALRPYFPQRNRIISGISIATIVIESAARGGSLITAKFAMDQSREVFAVPGNINSLKSEGTNLLIRNNSAIPALSPETVLDDLRLNNNEMNFDKEEKKIKFSDEDEEKIFELINFEPVHIDKLSELSGMALPDLLVKLLNMEFTGLIKQLPGKNYIREN